MYTFILNFSLVILAYENSKIYYFFYSFYFECGILDTQINSNLSIHKEPFVTLSDYGTKWYGYPRSYYIKTENVIFIRAFVEITHPHQYEKDAFYKIGALNPGLYSTLVTSTLVASIGSTGGRQTDPAHINIELNGDIGFIPSANFSSESKKYNLIIFNGHYAYA